MEETQEVLTEDQLKSIQELRDERQKYIREQEQLQAQANALQVQLRQLQLENSVENEIAAFSRDTGVKLNGASADVHKLLVEDGYQVRQADDGCIALLRKDGNPVSYADALEEFCIQRPFMVREWGSLRPESQQIQARDDFKDNAEKSRWIGKHGLQQWEQLPQHRVEQAHISTMTGKQYLALPVRQRLEILEKYGESGIAAILRRR